MTNLSNVLVMPWTATNDTNACYIRFNSSHPKCIA